MKDIRVSGLMERTESTSFVLLNNIRYLHSHFLFFLNIEKPTERRTALQKGTRSSLSTVT